MISTKLKQFFSRFRSKPSKIEIPIKNWEGEDGKGKLYVELEGEELAFLEYSNVRGKVLTLHHTEVSDKLRGKGVGKLLIEEAVAMARTQNLKIMPMCPYAKTVFTKNQDLRDVLKGW